jgi:hypothetical protein
LDLVFRIVVSVFLDLWISVFGYRSGSSFRMLDGLDFGFGLFWFFGFGSFSFADTKMEKRRGDWNFFRSRM